VAEAPKLAFLLINAARRIGATVRDGSPELVGSRFNAEVLSEAVAHSVVSRREGDLPTLITSVRIDDIPVLIGELSGAAIRSVVEPQLRRYRNQATIARSWLASEAPNLQLFLIGPGGSFGDSGWRQLAAEIEVDDRTCRKLVWLRDSKPGDDDAEVFLTRTFVARPWPNAHQQVLLDTVASYSLPEGWEEAADNAELDNDGLVSRLIALEEQA
jgi:hypothetical protein